MAQAEITKGREENKPGVYLHKESGQSVVIEDAHGVGNQIADAFVQVGFVRQEATKAEPKVAPVVKTK
jgi:hypothetical protein